MTTFDIIVSIAAVVVSTGAIVYMGQLAKHSGRDRPHDPERLHRFIENAPYYLLDKR